MSTTAKPPRNKRASRAQTAHPLRNSAHALNSIDGIGRLPPAPAPEPTDRDRAAQAEIMRLLKEIDHRLTLQNLHRVQTLVALALRGQVPQELADHLCVIGRNYGDLADRGPRRPAFRVVEGRAE